MSRVYAPVLQEESHKGIGHCSALTPKSDSVVMYANTRGNYGSKGGPKKERPLCTHCNLLGHTMDKCYKLHGYPPGYKHKAKPNSNANQVSYPQGQGAETSSTASAQCPISRAQCEQLLALFNTASDQGANHHVATVSTSAVVPNILPRVPGLPTATGASSSSNSSNNDHYSFTDTMAGTNSLFSSTPTSRHSIFSAKVVDRNTFHATDWVIDTGATDHMVHSISCFTTITATLNTFVNLPNGEVASVTHIGIVKISEHLTLHNVLCVPSFSFNLISVSQLAKSSVCCLIFFGNLCFIQDLAHWSTLGLGRECNGLYLLDKGSITTPFIAASISVSEHTAQPHLWHSRMGHPSNAKLASIKPNDVPCFPSFEHFNCVICPLAKQKRLPFNKSSHFSSSCFELIHCDLWGPFSIPTIDHCKYFLTIVDDYSRCTWVYLLKHKSQTQTVLEQFCIMVETQFSKKIKTLRSDNGTEFLMKDFFAKKGILHHLSCVETPQQNAIVERKHQHILNVARALMFHLIYPCIYGVMLFLLLCI